MSLRQDVGELRKYLDELASHADPELARYELVQPQRPPGLYWQLRWLAGRIVRWLQAAFGGGSDSWPVGLKSDRRSKRAKPLVIWAVGGEREAVRTACRRVADLQGRLSGFAPVLVTDVADFAFFSRLGWLVEYLPSIAGTGQEYEERKARFVAKLYRDAPALPLGAILSCESPEEILGWLGD